MSNTFIKCRVLRPQVVRLTDHIQATGRMSFIRIPRYPVKARIESEFIVIHVGLVRAHKL